MEEDAYHVMKKNVSIVETDIIFKMMNALNALESSQDVTTVQMTLLAKSVIQG